MINRIKNYFNLKEMSLERKMYNFLHIIYFFGTAVSSVLLKLFLDSRNIFYITIGISLMFLITMVEANRTGRFTGCAIMMSVAFNFFYMPLVYWYHGTEMSVIPAFFLLGLVYTAIMFNSKIASIVGGIESVFYLIIIHVYRIKFPVTKESVLNMEKDLDYGAAVVILLLASVCGAMAVRYRYIIYIEQEEESKKIRQDAMGEYIAKDMFLTNMSHEIRTPMNAIVGNVNLMLDETEDARTKDNVYSILSSCDALISIVNEIMDLSKSDTKFNVLDVDRFDFYELLMEMINMISVRIMDHAIDFYVYISHTLPRYLRANESKIRQIILGIINPFSKLLNDGSIKLSVDCDKINDKEILLRCCVSVDGMTEFDSFGTEENQYLQYCYEMIDNMGGSIVNKQNEGNARAYITLPLFVDEYVNIESSIDSLDNISVLYLEKNRIRTEELRTVINELKIEAYEAKDIDDMRNALSMRSFTYIIIASELYFEYYDILNEFLGNEKIITVADIGGNFENRGIYASIIRPLHNLNVFAALADVDFYSVHRAINKGNFELVNTNILVVDDNFTNLNVASAILKKYSANVLTASSGSDAIRVLSEKKVQLVFLDYMMPDLNGIDTLNLIREMDSDNKNVPAIALSANAVSGAREMFMTSGFNGFIPKPIDVGKLERCLKELLPAECIQYKRSDK